MKPELPIFIRALTETNERLPRRDLIRVSALWVILGVGRPPRTSSKDKRRDERRTMSMRMEKAEFRKDKW